MTAQRALQSVLTLDVETALLKRYLARRQGENIRAREAPAEGRKGGSSPDGFLRHTLRQAGFSPAALDVLREEGDL
jgi:hypothetical protein